MPEQPVAPSGRGQRDSPQSYLTAERLRLGSQGPSEAGSPSGRRWRRLGRGGQRERGQSSWRSRQRSANPQPGAMAVPNCSTAPHQSVSLALLPYTVLPKLFLALAATRLPPHAAAGAALSEPRQEASEETRLQAPALGMYSTSLLRIPPARGQCALTVRQEMHPLPQALEVSVPQGCLRRNPAFGFVLHKAPEKGNYTQSARARRHRGPVQGARTSVHPCTREHPSNSTCCVGECVSKRCAHHGGVRAIPSAICMCTRESTRHVTVAHRPHRT